MNFHEYQRLAQRTADQNRLNPERLHVAVLGLCSEAGEIASETKKAVEQAREVNILKIGEEIGDAMWYIAEVCSALGLDMDTCAVGNIEKLMRRYPAGFSAEASLARVDHRGQ